LQREEQARQEYRNSLANQKSGYKSMLDFQSDDKHLNITAEQQAKLDAERKHKGFTFECYGRDPIIANER
jgi:hypothetical protein